jgi:hypothetical protein
LLHAGTGAGAGGGGLTVTVRLGVGERVGVAVGETVGVVVTLGVADGVTDGVADGVGLDNAGVVGGADVDPVCPAEVHAHATSAARAMPLATRACLTGRSAGPSSTAGS